MRINFLSLMIVYAKLYRLLSKKKRDRHRSSNTLQAVEKLRSRSGEQSTTRAIDAAVNSSMTQLHVS